MNQERDVDVDSRRISRSEAGRYRRVRSRGPGSFQGPSEV